jgi:hypothetical protein
MAIGHAEPSAGPEYRPLIVPLCERSAVADVTLRGDYVRGGLFKLGGGFGAGGDLRGITIADDILRTSAAVEQSPCDPTNGTGRATPTSSATSWLIAVDCTPDAASFAVI